jgi:hypothetical protein
MVGSGKPVTKLKVVTAGKSGKKKSAKKAKAAKKKK